MQMTDQHLRPIFENITDLLGSDPGTFEAFAHWAAQQARRLREAADHGTPSLAYEAELIRDELSQLQAAADFTTMLTERTERIRLCQRQWLTGLLDFVDDLLEAAETHTLVAA